MLLARALDAFLLQLQADGRSPHTIGQYRRHVGALDRWLAASGRPREIAAIDHETLALFLVSDTARCRPDGKAKKATSTNGLRTSLRAFFAFCHAAGYVPINPARLIRRARCTPPPPRALSDAEVARLLVAVDAGEGVAARRDAMLIRVLVGTGLRLSSALALTSDDVDLTRRELTVRRVKNDSPLVLPIATHVSRDLARYIRGLRTVRTFRTVVPQYLFSGPSGRPLTRRQATQRLATWAETVGLRGKATAHAFRHTHGQRIFDRTHDLLAVQAALGHRSITSTCIYARLDYRGLRAAVGG